MAKATVVPEKETENPQVVDTEFTEEQTRTQMRVFEDDIIRGLIAAGDIDESEKRKVQIARNGTVFYEFTIRPLTEDEYDRCKKKHTKYVRNKQLGVKLPEDTNSTKYRCQLIYTATVPEDRKKLWDNKTVWNALNDKGFQIMNGLDVIEFTMRAGEKDRVVELIDKISGFETSNLEEVAKN